MLSDREEVRIKPPDCQFARFSPLPLSHKSKLCFPQNRNRMVSVNIVPKSVFQWQTIVQSQRYPVCSIGVDNQIPLAFFAHKVWRERVVSYEKELFSAKVLPLENEPPISKRGLYPVFPYIPDNERRLLNWQFCA